MSVRIRGLHKSFGGAPVLDDVDLSVEDGEFVALLGPSGSGKTTLLRLIAGLEQPNAGTVVIGARDAAGLAPGARGIGFVFQHYALFGNMNVFENVAFGLRVRPRRTRPARAAIRSRVEQLLALTRLEGLGPRLPGQLSGGQRQRVALARALAVEPQLLLLDEPFGALDQTVRVELRTWLRALHGRLGLTSIFVTHDQEEAFALADRVVLLNRGRVEQVGSPAELRASPASAFVRSFVAEARAEPLPGPLPARPLLH
jgi:sulfate transport system ATP-binding protein